MAPNHPSLTIRSARGSDGPALERLARLDSQKAPAGEVLVASADGELVAAYGVDTGARIGDPFRPTADVLDLLELRAGRGRPATDRAYGGWRREALRMRLA